MISPSRRAFLFLSALSVSHVGRGELVLCPDCGRETRSGDVNCRGCGKVLKGMPAIPVAQTGAEADTTNAPLDLPTVEQEAAEARSALKNRKFRQASFLAGNALSLHTLSLSKQEGLVSEMKNLVLQASAGLATIALPCPVCRGSGTRLELAITMKAEAKRLQGPNQLCLACSGVKTVPGVPAADDLRTERTEALRSFSESETRKGFHLQEGAWIPASVDLAVLPPRALVQLKKTTFPPCSSCVGIGRQSCKNCAGTGFLACTEKDCVAGKVVCPTCDGKKSESTEVGAQKAVRTCRTCQGRGIAACETCEGKGLLTCPRCDGAKALACRDCAGSGEPLVCKRCQGEGITPCTRCKGAGEYKGKPCEACKGDKEILCQTCAGSGRKKT